MRKIKSKVKFFFAVLRLAKQITKSKILRKRIPIIVSLHVTNKCNMRCKYCYSNYENRFDESYTDFTTRDLLNLIDEMYEMGTRWIVLLGGEPLLRDDIGKIIAHIKKRNILCEVVTNGILIRKKINQIRDVDLLCISLDGDEDINDAIRGDGTYRKALEGLKIASRSGIRTRIHAVLTTLNMNSRSINHLSRLSSMYSSTFGFSSPIIHYYNDAKELHLNGEKEKVFWKKVYNLKKNNSRVYNTTNALKHVMNWPHAHDKIISPSEKTSKTNNFEYFKCFAGNRACYIDSEGYMYPCICKGVKSGPNVKKMGFTNAWKTLDGFNCGSCGFIQHVEFNDIIDLKPQSVMLGIRAFLS